MKAITLVLFFLFCSPVVLAQENVSKGSFENKSTNSLTIYGSKECHYCQDTKAYLKEKDIPFRFYDIYEDPSNMEEMVRALKKAGMDLDNVRLPVVVRSDTLLMNSIGFESFLNELTIKR